MQKTICKALDEGRLAYKVLDQNFQASGGGTFDYRPHLPSDNKPGEWLPEIEQPEECVRGWHFTLDPLMWPGCVVFLVETKEAMTRSQKQAFSTGRLLKRVWHDEVVDLRIWARIKYPDLYSADLRYANLRYADLRSADLSSANLSYALYDFNHEPIPGWEVKNGILVKV